MAPLLIPTLEGAAPSHQSSLLLVAKISRAVDTILELVLLVAVDSGGAGVLINVVAVGCLRVSEDRENGT